MEESKDQLMNESSFESISLFTITEEYVTYSDSTIFLGRSDHYKVRLVSEKALICTEIE